MEIKKEIRSRLKKQRSLLGADECCSMRAKDAEFVLADYIQREMAPTSTGGQ